MPPLSPQTTAVLESVADKRLELDRGCLELWRPTPRVLVSRASGHMAESQALLLIEVMDRAVQGGQELRLHHEWSKVSGFATSCPGHLTVWQLRHAASVKNIDVIAGSTFVRMAVRSANIALGGVAVLHNDLESFEQSLVRSMAAA